MYERTERRGHVFERLRADIDSLAALTGMQDVFRLRAADIFRIVEITCVTPNAEAMAALGPAIVRDPQPGLDHAARLVTSMARAADLDVAVDVMLAGLEQHLGYEHTYALLVDETGERLYTIASRGYEEASLGAEIAIGDGQIGAVAARCEPIRIGGLRHLAKYSRTIRRQYEAAGVEPGRDEPLPGLADADSLIAVPAMSRGQLVGVLVAESRRPAAFDAVDEHVLAIVAAQFAAAVELDRDDTPDDPPQQQPSPAQAPTVVGAGTVRFFSVDGSVFVDGEYLIKGVAGRILRALLEQHASTGRTEFTNKELRLDPSLDLPGFKDNLESRLLLLRRRLDDRDVPIRIVRTGRGRFRLEVGATLVLERGDDRG